MHASPSSSCEKNRENQRLRKVDLQKTGHAVLQAICGKMTTFEKLNSKEVFTYLKWARVFCWHSQEKSNSKIFYSSLWIFSQSFKKNR